MNAPAEPHLVILSGPSGAGKSTVVKRLLAECPLPLELSVSATTRAQRAGEQDGVDYFFLSHDEFERRRDAGEFLEWKEVFGRGDLYGTLRDVVAAGRGAGKWVVLEIDVEGAKMVLQQDPQAITVFLHPGSMAELERRLRLRGTDSEEAIQRRLEVARRELESAGGYQHRVVNQSVDQAVSEIQQILLAAAGSGG